MADPESAIVDEEVPTRPLRTRLEAVDVGVRGSSGALLLSNVNAAFDPESVTAIIGPSGAGKSLLLRVLAGRWVGEQTGEVLVKGLKLTKTRCRLLMTLMPPNDALIAELTVKQTLYYAAMLRSPIGMTTIGRIKRADALMERLAIKHITNVRIGDALRPGISGGQRKRVSAAIEFLSTRPVLLMDEPTSGLDAATAMALVEMIRGAGASEGRTVIAAIHQPSWALCNAFSKIIVLGLGGRVVFEGQPSPLSAFFARFSPTPSPNSNPADHVLFTLYNEGTHVWVQRWEASTERRRLQQMRAKHGEGPGLVDLDLALTDDYPNPLLEQYRLLVLRSAHLWVTDVAQGQTVYAMVIAVSILVGLTQLDAGWTTAKVNLLLCLSMGLLQAAALPAVVFIPLERPVVQREWRNGVYAAGPYWFAHCTVQLLSSVLAATIATAIVYPMLEIPVKGDSDVGLVLKFWSATGLHFLICSILGLIFGVLTPTPLSGLKALPVMMILMALTSGLIIPLSRLRPVMWPFHYPNIFTWHNRIILDITFGHATDVAWEILTSSEYTNVDPGHAASWWKAQLVILGALVCLGHQAAHRMLSQPDRQAPVSSKRDVQHTTSMAVIAPEGELPTSVVVAKNRAGSDKNKTGADDSKLLSDHKSGYGSLLSVSSLGEQRGSRVTTHRFWFWPEARLAAHQTANAIPAVTMVAEPPGLALPRADAAIRGVDLIFEASTATALLGPSGAGKTCLMDAIGGRIPGVTQGSVVVDGTALNATRFRAMATYTPQDDVLVGAFTPRETLKYAALLRSPRSWSLAGRSKKIDEVATVMGIVDKLDDVIGTPENPGLSGGQKRRLSIGMDLLAERKIMVVDEPTTGLDAAAAMAVATVVVQLARAYNRTVISTIHQPPWALVCRFDSLVLLAAGRVVYCGVPSALVQHSAVSGAPCPTDENPAEHFMFVLTAAPDSEWPDKWDASPQGAALTKTATAEYLAFSTGVALKKKLEATLSSFDSTGYTSTTARAGSTGSLVDALWTMELTHFLTGVEPMHYEASLWEQYTILTRRSFRIFLKSQALELLAANVQTGMLVGLSFRNFGLRTIYFALGLFFGISSHAVISLNGLLLSIPTERTFVQREYQNGAFAPWVYWCARATLATAAVSATCIPQVGIWWYLIGLPLDPARLANGIATTGLLGMTFGHIAGIISLVVPNPIRASQISNPLVAVIFTLSGAFVVRSHLKQYLKPLYQLNVATYAFQNMMNAALRDRTTDGSAELLEYYGIQPGTLLRNYLILFAWLVGVLIAGTIAATYSITRRG
ncbi:hypothetical protein CTAYLR_006868 [Chrysophaeum taylorii]|uniref:ABC transporter domain-containing protein n=1 Tax=Chrysophaeum taylorii TaxID=2483200 RepID=A0AAD7U572_9STRA|nr:hypothetical protein CTAYLR_006868 [Chrysophaeum taylorii]